LFLGRLPPFRPRVLSPPPHRPILTGLLRPAVGRLLSLTPGPNLSSLIQLVSTADKVPSFPYKQTFCVSRNIPPRSSFLPYSFEFFVVPVLVPRERATDLGLFRWPTTAVRKFCFVLTLLSPGFFRQGRFSTCLPVLVCHFSSPVFFPRDGGSGFLMMIGSECCSLFRSRG